MAGENAQVTFGGGGNAPAPSPLLDQYKSYMADLGNIGTRYTAAQTFYFSIVSALIGVLAFKDASQPIEQFVSIKFIAIMLFIAAICYVWRATLLFYQNLFHAKFDTLRQLEQLGLFTVFAFESSRLNQLGAGSLVDKEARVPGLLMIFAIGIAIVASIYLATHK